MKVHVRQKHIDEGEKGNGAHCPIALAIWAQHPSTCVMVDALTAKRVSKKSRKEIRYNAPPSAQEFILDFDGGHPVKPETFEFRRSINQTGLDRGNDWI